MIWWSSYGDHHVRILLESFDKTDCHRYHIGMDAGWLSFAILLKWQTFVVGGNCCGRSGYCWSGSGRRGPWKEISHRVSRPSVSGWDGAANGLFTESNTRKFMVHVTPGITEKVSKRKQSVLAFLSVTTVSYHIWGDTHTKDQMLNLGTWQAMLTEQLQTLNPPRLYKDHDSSR